MPKYYDLEPYEKFTINKQYSSEYDRGWCSAIKRIMSDKPLDVQPVRHGHWVWDKDGMDYNIGCWRCSACGLRPATWWDTEESNPLQKVGSCFCGNCGAKMDDDSDA